MAKTFVEIELDPFTLNTSIINMNQNLEFNQLFFIPIHNNFSVLKINLKRLKPSILGILQDVKSSDLVKSFTIPLPYFRDEGEKQFKFKLPMDELYAAGLIEKQQIKSKSAEMVVFIKDLTRLDTMWKEFPNFGNNEEEEQKWQYGYKEAKNLIIRLTKVFTLVFQIYRILYNIFRYTYPWLSDLAKYGFLLVCLIYDIKLAYSYLILAILGFLFYTNPWVLDHIHPRLKEFLEKGTNPNILEKPCIKIRTKWEEELYNDKIAKDEDDGDITINPLVGA